MRRKVSILVLIFLLLVICVGCTPSASESETPVDEGGAGSEQETVNEEAPPVAEEQVVYLYSKMVEVHEQMKAAADAYTATHPGVTIEVETTDTDYATNLKAKFAGGQAPTIFMVQGGDEAVLWSEYLEDLSDQPWVEYMIESGKPAVTIDGKVMGWPVRVEAQFYVYNKDMFEQAGITELPLTLTELEDVFNKVEAAGYGVTDNAYASTFQAGMFVMNMGIARQDDPMAFIAGLDNGTETIANNEHFLDVANWVKLDTSFDDNPLGTDFMPQVARFTNKEAAIMMGGTWSHTSIVAADPNMNVGVMSIPINDDPASNGKVYSNIAPYMVVNKDDPAKEAAKDFLTWLATDPEGMSFVATEFQWIPAFTNIVPDYDAIGDIGAEALEFVKAGQTYGMYMAYWPDGGLDAFGISIQKYVDGQMTPEELSQALQDDWESLTQ